MGKYLDIADRTLESLKDVPDQYEKNELYEKSDEEKTIEELEAIMAMREQGKVPDHYTAVTVCVHCGPVPIWPGLPPKVAGCPWCFNRHKGLPIPRV